MDEELLVDEQTKRFRETASVPGEGAVRVVGKATEDLESCTHLVDRAGAG